VNDVPSGTTIVNNPCSGGSGQVSMSANASKAGTVAIGTAGQRLTLFTACSSSSFPCPAGQALLTAAVRYFDSDTTGAPKEGASLSIIGWTVNAANG
jgi:hypothetical protein